MDFRNCWYQSDCLQYPHSCGPCCPCFVSMVSLLQKSGLPQDKWFPTALVAGKDKKAYQMLLEIKDDIKNWVAEGNNLYLYSNNFGNGKTSWAIKLFLAYFNEIWSGSCFSCRGVFVFVPSFLMKNKEIISQFDASFPELKANILKADLVIWDDVASTFLTDYDHQLLFSCIDTRIFSKKANIFTGNVSGTDMKDSIKKRLTSRIWNGSQVIQFINTDCRGTKNG